jgi:alpha-glucosidase
MRPAIHAIIAAIASCIGVACSISPSVSTADDAARHEANAGGPSYTPLPIAGDDGAESPSRPIRVEAIPDSLRKEYRLDPFYKKYTTIVGIPIIGSDKVSDYAFLECAWTLDHLLHGRTMAHDALLKGKVRVGIIAVSEYTMDIPENQQPYMIARGAYNDRRSRGLGGRRYTTCAEENLLNLSGDHYVRENITIHEFSHTVASCIRAVNPDWYDRLREAYKHAKEKGDYGRSYAISDEQEYWAEGAQCWFDCANPRNAGGAANRDQLKAKDPALAALLTEVYGDGPWRYVKPANRTAAETLHLVGLDRSKMPAFDIRKSPRVQAAEKAK